MNKKEKLVESLKVIKKELDKIIELDNNGEPFINQLDEKILDDYPFGSSLDEVSYMLDIFIFSIEMN